MTFAITRKADGALLGAISLMGIAKGHKAEIGYWIGRSSWGQGICTEAARAVVRYAFTTLGLARVHAPHMTRYPASGRVMQKLGMSLAGSQKRHLKRWGRCEDLEPYGILRDARESS